MLALFPLAGAAQISTKPALIEAKTTSSTPLTRLRLQTAGGLYLGGSYDGGLTGGVPAEGSGTRLIWYPERAAFRAGHITAAQWSDANIGYNAPASGDYATALEDRPGRRAPLRPHGLGLPPRLRPNCCAAQSGRCRRYRPVARRPTVPPATPDSADWAWLPGWPRAFAGHR